MVVSPLSRCIGRPLVGARFEVAGNGVEQLATGCELALLAGDQVLETASKRVGLGVAAQFQNVRPPVGIFGFAVESQRVFPSCLPPVGPANGSLASAAKSLAIESSSSRLDANSRCRPVTRYLDTAGERVGLRSAGYFQHRRPSGRVFRFRVESHRRRRQRNSRTA